MTSFDKIIKTEKLYLEVFTPINLSVEPKDISLPQTRQQLLMQVMSSGYNRKDAEAFVDNFLKTVRALKDGKIQTINVPPPQQPNRPNRPNQPQPSGNTSSDGVIKNTWNAGKNILKAVGTFANPNNRQIFDR